jgi:hypothetical protein
VTIDRKQELARGHGAALSPETHHAEARHTHWHATLRRTSEAHPTPETPPRRPLARVAPVIGPGTARNRILWQAAKICSKMLLQQAARSLQQSYALGGDQKAAGCQETVAKTKLDVCTTFAKILSVGLAQKSVPSQHAKVSPKALEVLTVRHIDAAGDQVGWQRSPEAPRPTGMRGRKETICSASSV